MNIIRVTYNTYSWFIGEQYGMNLQEVCHVDIQGNIVQQLKDQMHLDCENNLYLKNKDVCGHILCSAWYTDNDGKIVTIEVK